ncbi:MAG: DUF2207 domain-containing protein, partial [Flavobacteriaceae bacterium]|nr:DUF2207 domain-containing protein [Flavobacteriaceae bacterium]
MKKYMLLFLAVIFTASSYAQDFVVNKYEVDVYINADGYFDVVENYDLTFDRLKHGIYRDIQTKYNVIDFEGNEVKREILISNIEVPDRKFETTNSFMRKLGGTLQIKIGDPSSTVSGLQHYEIKYRVKRAFLHKPNADRFYWNLKPTLWNASFQDIQFKIHLPNNNAIDDESYTVYSGTFRTTESSNDFTIEQIEGVIIGNAVKGFTSNYGDGVTILIDLPKGAIKEYKPVWPFWIQYGWTLIIGTLISGFYLLWRKHGKDDPTPTTISYHPPARGAAWILGAGTRVLSSDCRRE